MIMRQEDKETMRRYLSGQLITEPDSRESTNSITEIVCQVICQKAGKQCRWKISE